MLYIASFLILGPALSQADFTGTGLIGCGPLTASFRDKTPKAAKWYWDLGNGNTSTKADPSAIYTSPGFYTLKLTVTDSLGATYTVTKTNYVHVYTGPVAKLTSDKFKICPGDSISFSDISKAGDTALQSWNWDFGDGATSGKQNPGHRYYSPGYKNVSLTVIDKHGCRDQLQSLSYIRVITPPVADFVADSAFACQKKKKVFFFNASSPKTLTYQWDFGDGTFGSNASDPIHIYQKYGVFTVKLTVTDYNTGCKDVKSVPGAVILDSLVVDFDATPRTLCDTSMRVRFTNKVPLYQQYSALWTYGDGHSSTAWDGYYQYQNFGNYSVNLTITGPNCSASRNKSGFISVVRRPYTTIRANDTAACGFPFAMKLYATAPSSATISWDFGDHTSGNGTKVSHTWQKFDSFFVTAIAVDKNTCRDTQKMWIKPHVLDVDATGQTDGCVSFQPKLKFRLRQNSSTLTRVEWFYNQVRIDSGNNVSKLFADTGIFVIKLRAESAIGCKDSINIPIRVGVKIKPSFRVSSNKVCLKDTVVFYNTTKPISPVAQEFIWYPGEGGKRTENPLYMAYGVAQGKIKVYLVSRHYGCYDTFSSADSVAIMSPRVYFSTPSLSCFLPSKVAIANNSSASTRFSWYTDPPELSKTADTLWIDPAKGPTFKLHMVAFNDTNHCADSGLFTLKFFNNLPKVHTTLELREPCLPALAAIADSFSTGQLRYWILPGGDTLINDDTVFASISQYGITTIKRFAVNEYPLQTCVDSQVVNVIVPKPDTRFSISPNQGCTPVSSVFTDSAWMPGRKASWKFGDTSLVSSGKNNPFLFEYPFDSLKTPVVFTAYDSFGRCFETKKLYVQISGPDADIKANPFYTCKLTKLQLSYTPLSKGIKSVEWYADDTLLGTSSSLDYLVYDTRYVKVKLKIFDSSGCTSLIHKTVLVRMFRPDVKISSDTFGANCPPLVVHFKDKSTSYNNPVETWLWDFGDGSTSTFQNPTHTFIATGSYNITLKVKNFVGCFATKVFPAYIKISGPQGSIFSGNDSGCTPLTVKFGNTASGIKNARWDFGDGYESTGIAPIHTYNSAGQFVPTVILEDSAGCKLAVQSQYKIKTNQSPENAILQTNFCDGDVLDFQDKTNYFGAPPKNAWKLHGFSGSGTSFSYPSVKYQKDTLFFVSFGKFNCYDTTRLIPRKSTIAVKGKVSSDTVCIGSQISLTDLSVSDTNITSRTWYWQGNAYTDSQQMVVSTIPGYTSYKLLVQNTFGCTDSATFANVVFTGDSAAAPLLSPIYVSVTSDNSQQLLSRTALLPDWRYYSLYHSTLAGNILLQKHMLHKDTNYSISGFNALQSPQCFLVTNTNLCYRESPQAASVIHCTINLQARGDTNRVELNWSPYVGAKVSRYAILRTQLPNQTFALLDSVVADSLHYSDTTVTCSNQYAYKIVARLADNISNSFSDTAHATPLYRSRVGRPVITLVTVENETGIRVEFDPAKWYGPAPKSYTVLRSTDQFVYTNVYTSMPTGPFVLQQKNLNTAAVNYFYTVAVTDACDGMSPVSAVSSNVVLQASTDANGNSQLRWNRYQFWNSGVHHYEVQQQNAAGLYLTIASTADTSMLLVSPGAVCGAMPFFRVVAVSNQNPSFMDPSPRSSFSNTITLSSEPQIFIPNAFTPNEDQLNGTFKGSLYWVKDANLSIYDRWGKKLFEGNGCQSAWDGTANGNPVPEGVYVYRYKIVASTGLKYYKSGTFTLMR